MMVTVSEVFARLQEQKRTCVLTFQLEQERHLLKCFFNHGTLCHVSCGDRKNADCLPLLQSSRYKKYSFMDDAESHMPAFAESCGEMQKNISSIERVVDGNAGTVYGLSVRAEAIDPGVMDLLEKSLGDFVGPVAPVLLDRCILRLGYRRGVSFSRAVFMLVLLSLSRELPEAEQPGFISRCRRLAAKGEPVDEIPDVR
jgi:hypothetical protein